MSRRPLSAVLGVTVASVLVSACSGGAQPAVDRAVEPVAIASPASASPSASPSTSPTPSATPTPSPTATTAPTTAAPAAPSYDVLAVQRRLADLKYYGGAQDGKAGPALRSAVMAFQKVQGIGADGAVGPATLRALSAPRPPALKASSPANRVEVDLTKQVLYVVKGGALTRILPISSGNGATYAQKDGSKARALTPTGWYKVQRRIVGERKADLGTLYDPQYFYRGWAIHGSNSVPAYPASHGCIRVTRTDATWLLGQIGIGTSLFIYGGTHTFTAGSSAPGTDNPTGDTPTSAAPSPTKQPATSRPTSAAPKPSSSPEPAPVVTAPTQPTPTPSPSASASASSRPSGSGTSTPPPGSGTASPAPAR